MPNSDWFYATKPTRGTVFLRTFLPWQIWRFLRINVKMVTILRAVTTPIRRVRPAPDERAGAG